MGNAKLDKAARRRANAGLGPQEAGQCQHWVRETIQAACGSRFDALLTMNGGNCPSAKAFGQHLRALRDAGRLPAGVQVIETGDPLRTQVGDVLIKVTNAGKYGHVGIAVSGNLVAENSSTPFGRKHGAIGYRDLIQAEARPGGWWGRIQLVLRLPE